MIDPKLMCNKHLLDEHVECHMFAGCITKGKSIKGYIARGLFDGYHLQQRHDKLAQEMIGRGMNHQSPLDQPANTPCDVLLVDVTRNVTELADRCQECENKLLQEAQVG